MEKRPRLVFGMGSRENRAAENLLSFPFVLPTAQTQTPFPLPEFPFASSMPFILSAEAWSRLGGWLCGEAMNLHAQTDLSLLSFFSDCHPKVKLRSAPPLAAEL